jgi:hypothetical protein
MNNNGTPFKALENDLLPYHQVLLDAADIIVELGVSRYPILIVHQQELALGVVVVEREKVSGDWSVNASTLEEFITHQLIAADRVADFRKLHEKRPAHLCLFVITEFGANFVFLPR